ncbi:VMAP-C domain-containing protein [Streptomyces anulatus]|uniref:VMAP-C domain-containing protein n=1 Tax=Streptomyces anulatus TaxID=1892 RepID=UPI00368458A4
MPARLRTHLRDSLVQAFGIADQAGGGVPAPCEVVLPASYFDTPVHRWQLADEAPLGDPAHLPVGVRRRIVLRNADRRGAPDGPRLEHILTAGLGAGLALDLRATGRAAEAEQMTGDLARKLPGRSVASTTTPGS